MVNYTNTVAREYYVEPFIEEMRTLWGETRFKDELPALCHMAAQTCWLNKSPEDITERRKLVKAMGAGILDTETLKRYERIIPTSSIVEKYIGAIATLYNAAPTRVFSTDDDELNADLDSIYKAAKANVVFKKAYQFALFTNTVALFPAYDSSGKLVFRLLTPDLFRVVTDDDGNITEFWTIEAVTNRGTSRQRTEFSVWTPDFYYRADYRGIPIKGSEIENPYGRIPRVLLRLDEPVNADPYGSGDTDITELNVWANMMHMASSRTAIFQSFSIGIATNMGLAPGTRVAPDAFLQVTHDNPEAVPPSLDFATPSPTFEMVEDYIRSRVREEFRSKGIPSFVLDDSGTPPSGIALTILEREITEKRRGHIAALASFESEVAELTAIVVNTDGNRPPALQLPVVFPDFDVQYAVTQVYLDPKDQYALDMEMAKDGMLYPSTVVAKYAGIQGGLTDEEAIVIRDTNRTMWSGEAAKASDVAGTVGALNALSALQEKYEGGLISREAAIANVVQFLGRTPEQAIELFPPRSGS